MCKIHFHWLDYKNNHLVNAKENFGLACSTWFTLFDGTKLLISQWATDVAYFSLDFFVFEFGIAFIIRFSSNWRQKWDGTLFRGWFYLLNLNTRAIWDRQTAWRQRIKGSKWPLSDCEAPLAISAYVCYFSIRRWRLLNTADIIQTLDTRECQLV